MTATGCRRRRNNDAKVKGTCLPIAKASKTRARSAAVVVSSQERVSVASSSWRKLTPCLWPAARTSAAVDPGGGETAIVSKKAESGEVQPSSSNP